MKPKSNWLDLRTRLFTIRHLNFPTIQRDNPMKHPLIRRYLILALLLASIGISYADYDAGLAAYERQDYATALREFKPLAEQGDALAQRRLGLMYHFGLGVVEDYKAAVQWYSKAAEQGNALAQFSLGVMYEDGQGVAQDYTAAVQWYSKAAEQELTGAQHNLGLMYAKGEGVLQDYKAAVQWYSKAAQQGNAWAQFSLGNMYGNGHGVAQDNIRAHMWLNLAASNGWGTKSRDIIAKKMTTAAIEKAQRLARTCLESNYQDC